MAISPPASSFSAKCFAISPIIAVAAEAMLVLAWWNLAQGGAAPGLATALWVWPVSWLGCVLMGWAAAMWARRYEAPALDGGKLAAAMILNLISGVLLSGVPIIVSLYAAFMLIIALRVTAA